MFLKRIEVQGFKSFADKTVIHFNDEIVGIVGPNGCGKSNISDAVRWVLGEQSAKSLRGSQMNDVIFSGSEKRKGVNFAEVKLIFDNSNHIFDLPYQEVELARSINRISNENEYYINRNLCRLKDINELILDIGIGRDSLSIISQGNVSSFADAKPLERRTFFEEAAGVAKYKKRKIESLSKLTRTQENLVRLKDIISELEHQYIPLKRQAKKAEIYLNKKKELQEIEVSVLAKQIRILNSEIINIDNEILDLESSNIAKQTQFNVLDNFCVTEKHNLKQLDHQIQADSENLLHIVQDIQIHEIKKSEFEERKSDANESVNENDFRHMQLQVEQTKIELTDRQNRLEFLTVQEELNQENIQNIKSQLSDLEVSYSQKSELQKKYENQYSYLIKLKANPFIGHNGVQAVMDNKSLSGIKGVVIDLIKPHEGYEQAIETAVGGSLYNIITIDPSSARNAINYLKKNSAGRATFLPLSVLLSRTLNPEQLAIGESCKGFLGIASDFVTMDPELASFKTSILSNVIVVDILENANNMARLQKNSVKIVTLDGEVIHKGGSITGGRNSESASLLTIDQQISTVSETITNIHEQISDLLLTVNDLRNKQKQLESEFFEVKLNIAQIQPVIDNKTAKLTKLNLDLNAMMANDEIVSITDNDRNIIYKLNELYTNRDKLTNHLSKNRTERMSLSKDIEASENQIRSLRKMLGEETTKINEAKIVKATKQTQMDSLLYRLNFDYQLTYESAVSSAVELDQQATERAHLLRTQIQALGNINLDAPEQFIDVSVRYDFLQRQVKDLEAAISQLMTVISTMDEVMSSQFMAMFDQINGALPDVFTQLFGGGRAKLVLDSDDILNCGIDIDVQPPGKSVKNIRLFSGGEKCLIAISVLFAILKVRPVPLCILDEAEAALDPTNIERFGKYLRLFAKETQFVVITHRPGTMDKCDSLFGITMTNNGISQLLKIQLTQALDYASTEQP